MSLLNRGNFEQPETPTTAAKAPPWDTQPAAVDAQSAQPVVGQTTHTVSQTAVAVQPAKPVVPMVQNRLAKIQECSILEALKDAITVQWNTLERVKANQGRFATESANLGDELHVTLISWQQQWQASPGGTQSPETKKLVRYSSDGVYINDTTDSIKEYVNEMKRAGHSQAKLSERVVLVMQIEGGSPKVAPMLGQLCQIDLPPTGKDKFRAFRLRQANDLANGRTTVDQATRLKLTTTITKNGDNEYTLVTFDYAPTQA